MTKTATAKKRAPSIIKTLEGAEWALGEYTNHHNRLEKVTAMMNERLTKVRAEYEEEIAKLEKLRAERFDQLQSYFEENPDLIELDGKKSREFPHAVVGFEMGKPKLGLKKGFTWASILQLLKSKAKQYVRVKEEPMKDKLLADRNDPRIAKLLPQVGIEITQDESFFITLKSEEVAKV